MNESVKVGHLIRFASFEVNLRSGELRRDGVRLHLPEQSFQILSMLLERPGEVVMRQEIQKRLWPNDTIVEFENSINAAVKRLRVALEDSADHPRYVETLARRGYRWMAPVEWVEAAPVVRQKPVESGVQAELAGCNLIGKRVSHYRVLEILGGGGMGVVYEAEDIKLGRRVALKFLPEELASDAKALERFEREARAASALSHPNICTIYEIEEHEGVPFIVMELLQGETLRELIASAALSLEKLLELAIQISEGLNAAHQKGIIHRDIKPANILVTTHGQVKVLDFGLAKLAAGTLAEVHTTIGDAKVDARRTEPSAAAKCTTESSLSRAGVAMGTAGYMSPEQVRGEKLDARTDLFSFGLVLYEMATGQRAFMGETAPIVEAGILNQEPTPPRNLNPEIPARLEAIIGKAMAKDRGLRYKSALEMCSDLRLVRDKNQAGLRVSKKAGVRANITKRIRKWILAGAGVTLVIAGGIVVLHTRGNPRPGEMDTIMVSDFVNTTGDPIFDGTLKQAITVKFAESPYFNVLPEPTLRETLHLMGRSPQERILPPLAREVCQRSGAKVVIGGAIVALGNGYAIDVDAANCLSGSVVAHEEVQAGNRENVLNSLGSAMPPLRKKLGESLKSIQKFDTPIEQATTRSLAALKAYTSGDEERVRTGDSGSVPLYKMAIDLDPDFAIAYARLGAIYSNLANADLAQQYLTKAFEHRGHVSEREKFYIVSHYYADSTRETSKAVETLKLWTQTYPHDWVAFNNLSAEAVKVGEFQQAIEAGREALRLNPNNTFPYFSLVTAFFKASRFAEAKAICEQSIRAKRDSGDIHAMLLSIAFIESDGPAFQRGLDALPGEHLDPGTLNQEAWIAFTLGQVGKARTLFERSRTASLRLQSSDNALGGKDYAAFSTGTEAELEAELGNFQEAQAKAELALRLMPDSAEALADAAVVFASIGDFARSEQLAKKLSERFPSSTLLNSVTLPSIRAAAEIKKKNPGAAIEQLRVSVPYDLSSHQDLPEGITSYYRGLAYLALGSGNEAAVQFQKLIDNRGLIAISPYWPLAHLGLARANATQAHTNQEAIEDAARTRALAAYEAFFALWKHADPNIPILKQAKVEYTRLQQKAKARPGEITEP